MYSARVIVGDYCLLVHAASRPVRPKASFAVCLNMSDSERNSGSENQNALSKKTKFHDNADPRNLPSPRLLKVRCTKHNQVTQLKDEFTHACRKRGMCEPTWISCLCVHR